MNRKVCETQCMWDAAVSAHFGPCGGVGCLDCAAVQVKGRRSHVWWEEGQQEKRGQHGLKTATAVPDCLNPFTSRLLGPSTSLGRPLPLVLGTVNALGWEFVLNLISGMSSSEVVPVPQGPQSCDYQRTQKIPRYGCTKIPVSAFCNPATHCQIFLWLWLAFSVSIMPSA